jgi:hypothetical protein
MGRHRLQTKTAMSAAEPSRTARNAPNGRKIDRLSELTSFGQFDLDPQFNLRKYRVEARIPG